MNDFKVGDLVYIEVDGKRFYRVILDLMPRSDSIKIYYLDLKTIAMVSKRYIEFKKGYIKAI